MTARYSTTEDELWRQIQVDAERNRRRWQSMTIQELQEILAKGRERDARSKPAGWTQEALDAARVTEAPDLEHVVVAVYPGMSGHMCGIVVAGRAAGSDYGDYFVLGDYSAPGGPREGMERTVAAYRDHKADVIAGVVNNVGDYLEKLLHLVDSEVQHKAAVFTRGMAARSAPVCALYEQGRVHHVGVLASIETRMIAWTPDTPGTESQVNALVCAITELTR